MPLKFKVKILSVLCMLLLTGTVNDTYANDTNNKSTHAEQSDIDQLKISVADILNQLHQFAAEAKGEQYFQLFSKDAVYIGTDASETWSIDEFKTFATPYFSKGKGWDYRVTQRNIYFSSDKQVAWFDELLWNDKYGVSRGSGVLEYKKQQWKIAHYHLTFPIPNELAAEFTRQIKLFEKNKN